MRAGAAVWICFSGSFNLAERFPRPQDYPKAKYFVLFQLNWFVEKSMWKKNFSTKTAKQVVNKLILEEKRAPFQSLRNRNLNPLIPPCPSINNILSPDAHSFPTTVRPTNNLKAFFHM